MVFLGGDKIVWGLVARKHNSGDSRWLVRVRGGRRREPEVEMSEGEKGVRKLWILKFFFNTI